MGVSTGSGVVPTENFYIRVFAGDKDLYDHATDPSGASGGNFVCHSSYAALGVFVTKPEATNWDVTLFRFTARGNVGDELNWALDGRVTGTGLSTRILDEASTSVDITDNFVRIVPEPGGGAILALGGTALLALRRRR